MNPKNSQDLFNKIRSQFTNIRLGDENGAATAEPLSAVFFEFEFKEDADTFGSVSVSIADGETMKVFYNRNLVDKIDEDSKDEWYAFLKELKDFAVEHQLRFDVRDITKSNLTKQDYETLADTNKTVNTDEMSEELNIITKLAGIEESKSPQENIKIQDKIEKIKKQSKDLAGPKDADQIKKNKDELARLTKQLGEGLTGTAKRSYENISKTRLIIRHKGKVDETVPGSRSRQIQSLYIENEDGERFKYPLTHLAGARAMTRHVANGGRPHDEFGEHIVQTSEDIAKLNSFSRYVTNKDQLNDNAGDIIEQTKMKLENLRTYVKNLSKQSHYDEASKSFKTSDEVVLDDETVAKLREKFTMKNLDNRVEDALPLINRIMSEFETTKAEQPVNELDPGDEPIDSPAEPQVDHGAVVQSFLTDPENKLILRKDDSADKMLAVTKFKDKSTMLGSILSDIASRMLTKSGEEDRVANFASRVADGIDQEGSGMFRPGPDYNSNKKIAVQLAKRYIDDYKKMKADPAYADEVRQDPDTFNPKKHPKLDKRARGEATEFEEWAEGVANEWAEPKDDEDRQAKLKALQDLQMDTNITKDPELQAEIQKRKKELELQKEDDGDERAIAAMKVARDGDYLYHNGKEIDQGSIEYEMQDYSDGIFELHGAKYADGTELDEKELEELESTDELQEWVRIDYVSEDNQLEGLAFEDIKPYVSMYKSEDGKTIYDVLNKDGKSDKKFADSKAAMAYLSQNFNRLKENGSEAPAQEEAEEINSELDRIKELANIGEDNAPDMVIKDPDDEAEEKEQEEKAEKKKAEKKESLKESRTKIVEAIKSKTDDHAQNISGIEGDSDRVTGEAGLQIARIKYLSQYQ